MENKKGKSSTRAKNKYNAANYDRLYPSVQKGKKDRYIKAAEKAGIPLNQFIESALDEMADKLLEDK